MPSRPSGSRSTSSAQAAGNRGGRPKGGRSSADPAGVNGRRLGYGNAHGGSRASPADGGWRNLGVRQGVDGPARWHAGPSEFWSSRNGRRQKHGAAAMGCAILLGLAAPVQAQSSGASIVDEALKGVQEDQARDAERVRRMVDEAVKGTEAAPSGLEAVNPPAPAELQPLPDDTPGALPAGYRPEDLAGKPVRDGTSTESAGSKPWCSTDQRCRAGDGRLHAVVRAAGQDIARRRRIAGSSPAAATGSSCSSPRSSWRDARLCLGPAGLAPDRRLSRLLDHAAGDAVTAATQRLRLVAVIVTAGMDHQRLAAQLGHVLDSRRPVATAVPSAPASRTGRSPR